MKLRGRIAACFCALSLAVGLCASMPTGASAAPDEFHDDWLHTEGNKIVDMNGNEVWLTGANWFGYNVGSQVFDGVWSQNMRGMLTQIADHGLNILRVPMSTEILLQWKTGGKDPQDTPKVNVWENPELTVEGKIGGTPLYSFDIWNLAVKWCRELGIKIFIDIHSASTHSAGHQFNMWYDDKFSTEDLTTALCWFADYYKDDDTIVGIDIKNEPHGTINEGDFAKWDGSTDKINWPYVASQVGAKILDVNPNLLILVEGTECYPKFEEGNDWNSPELDYTRDMYSYYHTTWWGGNFRGAREFPVDFGSAAYNKQLVYSPHDYGPLVYEQEWFKGDFDYDSLMEDCWYDNWAYLYEEGTAPLLIGEWGGFIDDQHDPDGRNRMWLNALRQYITENKIHHTFWCFNENSGDTGGLVYDNFGKWDEDKYEFLKPALWQNKSGKFVGLDHKTPLGSNGITVSQYYGAPDEPEIKTIAGDCNDDKLVNVIDMALLKAKLINNAKIDETKADMNADGKITEADLKAMSAFVLKGKK